MDNTNKIIESKKYYVKLNMDTNYDEYDPYDLSYMSVPNDNLWLDDSLELSPEEYRHAFTLDELAKKTHSKLVRGCGVDDITEIGLVGNIMETYYWTNPLFYFEELTNE